VECGGLHKVEKGGWVEGKKDKPNDLILYRTKGKQWGAVEFRNHDAMKNRSGNTGRFETKNQQAAKAILWGEGGGGKGKGRMDDSQGGGQKKDNGSNWQEPLIISETLK